MPSLLERRRLKAVLLLSQHLAYASISAQRILLLGERNTHYTAEENVLGTVPVPVVEDMRTDAIVALEGVEIGSSLQVLKALVQLLREEAGAGLRSHKAA